MGLKILLLIDFPSETIRIWDGSGPFMDVNGDVWRGCGLMSGLDVIEAAINGEAYTLELALSGVDKTIADVAWGSFDDGEVIGSEVRILVQDVDTLDQPIGAPVVRFTGSIDNMRSDERVENEAITAVIAAECTNRFSLRSMTSGAVLSDVDQRVRSALLNPSAAPDRICERVPTLIDKTIVWPRW